MNSIPVKHHNTPAVLGSALAAAIEKAQIARRQRVLDDLLAAEAAGGLHLYRCFYNRPLDADDPPDLDMPVLCTECARKAREGGLCFEWVRAAAPEDGTCLGCRMHGRA